MTAVHEAHGDAAQQMDRIYRFQRFIYDASRKYYLVGRDRLLGDLSPPPGGTVLEVGCGTGRNLILAARRYPEARFYGFDISSLMLDTARRSILRGRLGGRITVAQGDATRFSGAATFGLAHYDRVFVSYALSMIPDWRAALRCAFGAVATGGALHIVDFGDQAELPAWFRAGLLAWLAKFSVEPRNDLAYELEAVATEAGGRLHFASLYRGYAAYAVLKKD